MKKKALGSRVKDYLDTIIGTSTHQFISPIKTPPLHPSLFSLHQFKIFSFSWNSSQPFSLFISMVDYCLPRPNVPFPHQHLGGAIDLISKLHDLVPQFNFLNNKKSSYSLNYVRLIHSMIIGHKLSTNERAIFHIYNPLKFLIGVVFVIKARLPSLTFYPIFGEVFLTNKA